MWRVNGAFLRGAEGLHRANRRTAKRKNGFSHPAQFEVLEERLPLNAAGGAVTSANPTSGTAALPSGNPIQFGGPTPGGQFGGELTLVGIPLPGTGNPTSSPTPGVFGGELSSSQVPPYDDTAFNNPSWVPQDRPPFPMTAQPDNGLPANTNQVVGTPFGIRNFLIGANTSVAHGSGPRMGLGTSTVRRPTDTDTRTTELLERPLDEDLLAAKPRVKASAVVESAPELATEDGKPTRPVLPEDSDTADAVAVAYLADETLDLAAPLDELAGSGPALSLDGALNGAAVDQTMAEQFAADFVRAGAAVAEAASQESSSADPQSASAALHAMAASLAVGAATVDGPQSPSDEAGIRRRSMKRQAF